MIQKIRGILTWFFFTLASLTACSQSFPTAVDSPVSVPAEASATTASSTPIVEEKSRVLPPKPGEQVYTDPEGWYTVNFPAEMQTNGGTNYFAAGDAFFETGYLPAAGTFSTAQNVCAWLANIVEENPENLEIMPRPSALTQCSITTKAGISPWFRWLIFENFNADAAHRFIYIKTKSLTGRPADALFYIDNHFSWLLPIGEEYHPPMLPTITSQEKLDWKKTAPSLENVLVSEYRLPAGANPYREMLMDAVPPEARPAGFRSSSLPQEKTPTPKKISLNTLGYTTQTEEISISSGSYPRQQLYRDGRLLFDYVFDISDIYHFETENGPLTAFVVATRSLSGQENAFLIQNDAILAWKVSHQDPAVRPILYDNQLLWLKVSSDWKQVQALTHTAESSKIVFSFTTHIEPMYLTKAFKAWQGHWTWAAGDFLIQDGKILNDELGFQEIFLWYLADGQPAYLFRKNGRLGFSYAGKILPLEYQNAARNLCCGYAVNNPSQEQDRLQFFAQRNGVWYYVVLRFR